MNLIDTIENVLQPMGLMSGPYAIPKRMIVGGLIGGFIVTWLKPEAMFEKGSGKPRPWNVLVKDKSCGEPTGTPWFMGPAIGALSLGIFI